MKPKKTYYRQMLIFIVLTVILSVSNIYSLSILLSKKEAPIQTEEVKKVKPKKEKKEPKIVENSNEDKATKEFVQNFVEVLFNYDEKTYQKQVSKVEGTVSNSVYSKLKKGLFFSDSKDKVTCKLESTNYFWGNKADNDQSVIVEINLDYTVNKQEMILKQLIKIDMEFKNEEIVIYNYELLNNPT